MSSTPLAITGGVVCWKRTTSSDGASSSSSSSAASRRGIPASAIASRSASADPARPRLDVRAVHRQRRHRLLEAAEVASRRAPHAVDLGRERRRRLLALGLVRPRAELARVAGELGPQRGQLRLARGIDEERREVVEELVADRAGHGPVAQPLAGVEDLLHPHALHAGVAQPGEVARRIGEPVRVVDPQPVDEPLAHERQREPVGLGEDLGVLLAHAREVVDVEEAPVAAGLGVDVEELPPALGVGPVRVRVVGRHVVGHDVEHDPEPGLARRGRERAEPLLAAERVRQPRRVGHVVAVRGARARLEGRREVEVRDAEVAQVGHERAGLLEAQALPELEAVGGAHGGQDVTRRRITVERAMSSNGSCADAVERPRLGLRVRRRELERPAARRSGGSAA